MRLLEAQSGAGDGVGMQSKHWQGQVWAAAEHILPPFATLSSTFPPQGQASCPCGFAAQASELSPH